MNSLVLALAAGDSNASGNPAQGVGVDADDSIIEIAGDEGACRVKEAKADIADRAGCMESVLISEVCRIAAGAQ